MSYILDALRKADAQRDRQRLPGLQAHPSAADAPPARDMAGMGYAIGGVLLVGVLSAGIALWQGMRQEPAPVAATPAPAPAPVVAAPAPAPVPAPAPAPAPEPARAIVPAAPIVVEVPAPPPRPARPVADAAAAAEAQPSASAAPQAPRTPQPTQAPAARAAAPMASAKASAPAAMAAGAPAGAPPIAVSGGVYSPSPAQRLLIVNGQVFNEGSEVAPGVTLEQVERGRAVLNFRGQRFTLPY